MSDTKLELDLDPKKVIAALNEIAAQSKELSAKIEEAIGKEAVKNFKKLEDQSQESSDKISTIFRNLGNRLKEDMKSFLGLSALTEGMNMAKNMKQGAEQVFEMEKAFDRLNTRLGLSVDKMNEFKKMVAMKVAGTGQSLDSVLPGMEKVSAKGGVKNSGELANIAEMLGQSKAVNKNENVEGLADTVVEILQRQGEKVTDKSFKRTLDALEGGRIKGAMGSAGEVGDAVKEMAATAKKSGMGTRDLAGLAAVASKGGEGSLNVLKQIMAKGATAGGQEQLNSTLGVQLFKNGKMDPSALGKINTGRFGQYSEQAMEGATGLHGASGADLTRFASSFKDNMGDFDAVSKGANETADQFGVAADNFSSKFDQFKEKLKGTIMVIGDDLSKSINSFLKGDFKGGIQSIAQAGGALMENKGAVAGGLGMTAVAALLAGGGLSSIMSKIPGGGMIKGAIGGEVAKMAGATPVYVVNASDIGGGGAMGGGAMGMMGKAGGIMAAAGVGVAIGEVLNNWEPSKKVLDAAGDKAFDMFGPDQKQVAAKASMDQNAKLSQGFNERNGTNLTPEQFAKAVETGMLKSYMKRPVQMTNPSATKGNGTKHGGG